MTWHKQTQRACMHQTASKQPAGRSCAMPPPPPLLVFVVVAAMLLVFAAGHGLGCDGAMDSCTGTVGECVADDGAVVAARRELGGNGYIGYGAMAAGNVPCSYAARPTTTAALAAPPTPTPGDAPKSPSAGASHWSMARRPAGHMATRKILAP
ncbi:hypothetical protein HU200_064733 [Digitaria exilis]|uniref:Uncharacterized protein n=1 Tax=Digitaria exilis TaxID=1010633 RepID=A0A835A335_9POAL|nr:hypothetical protein HU200_064733 [Digitaria exilis]